MATRNHTRRRRKPVHQYSIHNYNAEEEKLVQQAIENSKKMTRLSPGVREMNIPLAPTFYPTVEEFEGCPLDYIEKIRPMAQKYGICKIVPPDGWNPPFSVDMKSKKEFQTKEQLLHRIQEGISFGDGEEYSAAAYLKMAIQTSREWMEENMKDENGNPSQKASLDQLEKSYWDLVEISHEKFTVEYGNDVDSHEFGSGFPRSERGRGVEDAHSNEAKAADGLKKDLPEPKFGTKEFFKESYWNLNNIPNCSGSILKHIKVGINGINVPWMYFGNLFSTFCWHNEDNYLYSINYHHWGAPKVWYGVPGTETSAKGLEQVFKSYLSMKMRDVPDLMYHITTMFSPRLLQNAKVPVYKIIQHPGEFVITFPMAFHGGFSMGPNAGEAVNFATHDWILHGADANERYRSFARPAVFSQDRLTFTMANHLKDQRSHHNCELLLNELNRVIKEEMRLRTKLLEAGVCDISNDVQLPQNKVDQLDEDSADYDDKRMCFSCKHICFFSCVACECSKSKVSCLRHSHFMCRCPMEKRYMMVWSTSDEMYKIYDDVKVYLEQLTIKGQDSEPEVGEKKGTLTDNGVQKDSEEDDAHVVNDGKDTQKGEQSVNIKPPDGPDLLAPGAAREMDRNKNFLVDLSETSPISFIPRNGQLMVEKIDPAKRKREEEDSADEVPAEKMVKDADADADDSDEKEDSDADFIQIDDDSDSENQIDDDSDSENESDYDSGEDSQ